MEMTSTPAPARSARPHPTPVAMNGVDTPALLATAGAVKVQPRLAEFTFRATNFWQQGTHSRTRIDSFDGAGGHHPHLRELIYDADYPQALVGRDQGPTPVEFLLHALASCLTAGIARIAAERGVQLYEIESSVEGDMDVSGLLGLSPGGVDSGYRQLRVGIRVKGNAPAEKLRAIVEHSRDRSVVHDVLANGVPVDIAIDAG